MGVCFVIENIIIDYSHDDGDGSSHLDEPDKPDQLTCGNGRIGVIQDSGMSNKVGEWYEIIEAAHSPLWTKTNSCYRIYLVLNRLINWP